MIRNFRRLTFTVLVAVGLSGCGVTATPSALPLTGTPSLSISVALNAAGCDQANDCLIVGTTGVVGTPNSVAQLSHPGRSWRPLAVPTEIATTLSAVGCNRSECLVVGSGSSRDLVWRWRAGSTRLEALVPPVNGQGALLIQCTAAQCQMMDSLASDGSSRLLISTDHGTTWTPSPLPTVPLSATTTGLAVLSPTATIITSEQSGRGSVVTADVKNSAWVPQVLTPATTLSSFSCRLHTCWALRHRAQGVSVVRGHFVHGQLTMTPLTHQPTTAAEQLSCTADGHCIASGLSTSGRAWLATYDGATWTTRDLLYVAGPFLATACGAKRCVATTTTTSVVVSP
jgi:hypothetical protein